MTHTIKGVTGIQYVIKEMTGKHQAILTKGSNTPFASKLNSLIADIVVEVGSIKNPSEQDLLKIPVADKKKILVESRNHSLDFETEFNFNIEWINNGKSETLELTAPLHFPFDEKPYLVGADYLKLDATELSDLNLEVRLTLPKSKKEVAYNMLDGFGELRASKIKKTDLDSNSPLTVRNLREITKAEDGKDLPMTLDPNLMSIKDIEFIRKDIKVREGDVDTLLIYEHPVEGEKSVDLLQEISFFFPSGAV